MNYAAFFLARSPTVYMSNTISDGFSMKLMENLSNDDGDPK